MMREKHPGTELAEVFHLSQLPRFQNPRPVHYGGQHFHFREMGKEFAQVPTA